MLLFRSRKLAFLVKYIRNKPTAHDGPDYEKVNEKLHIAVSNRIGDGGLHEGLYRHRKDYSERNARYFYRYSEDDHMIYSLNKRKR